MGRLFKFFLFIFLSTVPTVQGSYAQTADEETQYADSTIYVEEVIKPRTISQTDWGELTRDSAFSYAHKLEAEVKPSVPSDFEIWLNKAGVFIVQFLFSTTGAIIFWLLIVLLLAFVLFKMFRGDFRLFFKRVEKPINKAIEDEMTSEDVMNTDWESRMALAKKEGDLRLATRFLFVHTLQILHHKQHIIYSIDKTNFDYYRMINKNELKSLYRILMTRFEYVWFGQKQLDEQDWKELMQIYEQLKLKS